MRKVKFIVDFATKKAGDEWLCDGLLASQLVRLEKVAAYVDEKAEVVEPVKKPKK